MAIVKMDRVEIYGLNKMRKAVLEYLHKSQIMEFSDIPEEGLQKKDTIQYISQFDSYIASSLEAISILEKYEEKKGSLFSKRPVLSLDHYILDKEEINRIDGYIRRVIKNHKSIAANEENIGKIKAKLYLLDEPIAGVDPAAREYILSTIVSNYNPEASIIITTHLIADVEQVLDDFVFLTFGGNILKTGNAEEARNESGKSLDALFREVFRC